MKYLVSFRTTLKISRYLFRTLVLLFWILGMVLTIFYIIHVLHNKKLQVRQEFNDSYAQAAWFIRHAVNATRELKFIAGNRLDPVAERLDMINSVLPDRNITLPQFYPLDSSSDCSAMNSTWRHSLDALSYFLQYWKENYSSPYQLKRVFFSSSGSKCLADFGIGNGGSDDDKTLRTLQEHLRRNDNSSDGESKSNLTWVKAGIQPDSSSFYLFMPLLQTSKEEVLLGIEQNLHLEDFIVPGSLPVVATLVDENNAVLLSSAHDGSVNLRNMPGDPVWFGYVDGYKQLILKRQLTPTRLGIIYSVPTPVLMGQLKMLIINAVLLNIACGGLVFTLAWMFERRMFRPAEENAHWLEEHEQFNRKIVASAPVGICILRISDGTNILSNELAHNYLNLLTQEDRHKLTEMICGQQVNFVDVLTGSNANLQISFVHSRYRNENVAICVLVDVSVRIRMEESLHDMAQAAEQASQSKSMFLATVSHELRTPLYGIIGNLDLLQTRPLPEGADLLVAAMHNSSSMLLKIISDILDFSKIESEQLRIEPRTFSPREVLSHITANYLSLIVRKRLTLYVMIESSVPAWLDGDPMRLQQVLSNLLSNAIKFTHTGGITLHAAVREGYLVLRVRDTGVGIPTKELSRLFDPFFQVGTGVQRNFQGTGLGLAICEKLINMMDGDIKVDSEPGMGSQFIVRIPLYNSELAVPVLLAERIVQHCWLVMRNDALADYLLRLLTEQGIQVSRSDTARWGSDDIVITDWLVHKESALYATVRFDSQHLGGAQEQSRGCWVISTAMPHELPALLERICGVAAEPPESVTSLPLQPARPDSNDDITILVVDDHPINRLLLSDQLGTLGYRVKTAQDGVDALKVISRSAIDILLTDVNMPNMDGYCLTQRLRQIGQTFPIIGVTANALAEEKQRCMAAGMDNCLAKPITLDTLHHALGVYASQVRESRIGNSLL